MKNLRLIIFYFTLLCLLNFEGAAQEIVHKKTKSVYIGAIFGGVYGYLDWNQDVENSLKLKKYSDNQIEEIERLCKVENHPKHINSKELFHANRFHFHNFHVLEIASFESLYAPDNKMLKYKLLWIPFEENQTFVDGIKPTDKNGFYVIMHRMSVKSKADLRDGLSVVSKEELDAINAEKARIAKEKAIAEEINADRLMNTYTVSFILQKISSNIISSAVYYSAVFVEIYDSKNTQSESNMRQRAENELRLNVQMNGYQIHSTYFYKMTAQEAKNNVNKILDLSDSRIYKIEL